MMKHHSEFDKLIREERIALCQEIMENLSERVEGNAPPDFCERVEELLGNASRRRQDSG